MPTEKTSGSRVLSVRGNQRWRLRRTAMKPKPSSAGVMPPTSSGVDGSKCAASSHGMPERSDGGKPIQTLGHAIRTP